MSDYGSGVHPGLTVEEYDAIPALRSSIASTLWQKTPAHARYEELNPEPATSEMDLGTAAHALYLEGEDVIEIIEADSWRKTADKEARDAARARGKVPLLPKQVDIVRDMVSELTAKAYFDRRHGLPEVTIVWDDPIGVRCKCRVDWLGQDRWFDFKTTDIPRDRWLSSVAWSGTGFQKAFYSRAPQLRALEHRWLVQERFGFFLSWQGTTDAQIAEICAYQAEMAISRYAQCKRERKWPGYPDGVYYAQATPGVIARHEETRLMKEPAA